MKNFIMYTLFTFILIIPILSQVSQDLIDKKIA